MTLDECEDTARHIALSLPPSDFGSTRAIQAFAQTLRAVILKEREACAKIAHDLWDDPEGAYTADYVEAAIRNRT